MSNFTNSLNEKIDSLYKHLGECNGKIKGNINGIVTESLISVKVSIIETLKAENLKLRYRIDSLEEKFFDLDISRNKLDQYIRRNNVEIQRIPAKVSDDHLEDEVLHICKAINLTVQSSDIEACHKIGKGNPKTIIASFVIIIFCNLILDKKHELKKIANAKFCFQNNVKCMELRRARQIDSSFYLRVLLRLPVQ